MSRIDKRLEALKRSGEKALIAFVVAGDPDLETTAELIVALDGAGVDILEIGVPFSDPTADGVIIQEASQRALKQGTTLPAVLEVIRSVRERTDIPIVLFGYYNPIFAFGNEAFARAAKAAGVDGLLVVDLPPEESRELRRYTDRKGLDFISLVAPTTPDRRIGEIAGHSSGFLYYISMTGVTGTGKPDVSQVKRDLDRIRKETPLPVMVGFGISTPGQAGEIAPFADGVVVGSALVRLIHEEARRGDGVEKACRYVGLLKKALRPTKNERIIKTE